MRPKERREKGEQDLFRSRLCADHLEIRVSRYLAANGEVAGGLRRLAEARSLRTAIQTLRPPRGDGFSPPRSPSPGRAPWRENLDGPDPGLDRAMRPMPVTHFAVAAIRHFQVFPNGNEGVDFGDQHLSAPF